MGAPLLIRQPRIVLIRHQRHGFHDLLRNRKKEARPILRNLKRSDRHDDAILSRREKPSRSNDRIISPVFRAENNVPDLATILSSELRTSAPIISSVLKPGASSSILMSGLASFLLRLPTAVPRLIFGSRASFCLSASSSSLSPRDPIGGPAINSRMFASSRSQSSCRP